MGSISDTPPAGPYIPVGWSHQDVQNDLQAKIDQYSSAYSLFSFWKSIYPSRYHDAVDAAVAYKQAKDAYAASPTQQNLDAMNAAAALYNSSRAFFASGKASFLNSIDQFSTATTELISAKVRSVLDQNQTFSPAVKAALSNILSIPAPNLGSFSASLPAFPWLTTDQQTLMQQDVDGQLDSALTAVESYFTTYRHSAWECQQSQINYMEKQMAVDDAYILYQADPNPSTENAYNQRVSDLQAAIAELTEKADEEATLRSDALSAFETNLKNHFGAISDITKGLVDTINNYATTWATQVETLRTTVAAAIDQAIVDAKQALIDARNKYFAATPTENPEVTQELYAASRAETEALTTALSQQSFGILTGYADVPALAAPSPSMSLSQLIRIISQSQLASQAMARSIASVEGFLNTNRRQYLIAALSEYGLDTTALQSWYDYVAQTDVQYIQSVEVSNAKAYSQFADVYTIYYNNPSVITAAVDSANAEISAQNDRGAELAQMSGDLETQMRGMIEYYRIHYAEVTNTLDIASLIDEVLAPENIPEQSYTTPESIPSFPYPPTLPALPYAQYPGTSAVDPALIDQLNATVKNFSIAIAPYKDYVVRALQTATGYAGSLDLNPIVLDTSVGVRDNSLMLSALEDPTTLIAKFLLKQFFIDLSQDDTWLAFKSFLEFFQNVFAIPASTQPSASDPTTAMNVALINRFASAGEMGAALNKIIQSETFQATIKAALDWASILAGLQAAGETPESLTQRSVFGLRPEDLGIQPGVSLDEETKRLLMLRFIEQLSTQVMLPGALRSSALAMIRAEPTLAGLSAAQLKDLIAALISMQQMMFLAIAILVGLKAGMTVKQLITDVLKSDAQMIKEFERLGFPAELAKRLAAALAEEKRLMTAIETSGLKPTTVAIVQALIAAAAGKINLTAGVPGGSALLDTLVRYLKAEGITVPPNISSPEFIGELVANLEVRMSEEKRDILRREILRSETLRSEMLRSERLRRELDEELSAREIAAEPSPQQAFADTFERSLEMVRTIFAAPPEPTSDQVAVSEVRPSTIMNRFVEAFRKLPEDTRAKATEVAKPYFKNVPQVNDEQKAALGTALAAGVITRREALSLISLLPQEQKGVRTSLVQIETELIHKLFTKTEEELRVQEEAKRTDILKRATFLAQTHPSVVPQQVLEQLRQAYEEFSRNVSNERFSASSLELFAKTVRRLSDFNEVALSLLLDPAKSILKQFSLLTRTTQDQRFNPPILLGG